MGQGEVQGIVFLNWLSLATCLCRSVLGWAVSEVGQMVWSPTPKWGWGA